jgi:hypothetical protein
MYEDVAVSQYTYEETQTKPASDYIQALYGTNTLKKKEGIKFNFVIYCVAYKESVRKMFLHFLAEEFTKYRVSCLLAGVKRYVQCSELSSGLYCRVK